ncbi:d-amino acid oxidase [Scheffersomyces xylosifermentans]|uniref:d-amino acid oxidase n=1 Tax=Scheffersomyces xylosifermentans TaxID=1304137 RepID=UPI00315D523F
MSKRSKQQVVIVGAGVLGLSTALAICERVKRSAVEITIIAEYGPHDPSMNTTLSNHIHYTSPWAGAHFRPFPSKNPQEAVESKLTRVTLRKFEELAKTNPESSIEFVEAIEYFESPDDLYKNIAPGFSEGMNNFAILPKEKLPDGVDLGVRYDTWVVNAPLYLQFLQRKLKYEYQVKFIQTKLTTLRQVNLHVPNQPIIINCSGTGLQYDGGHDPTGFPIRGQTLLINPPANCPYYKQTITHQSKEGLWTFVIPRPLNGGIILGGTKQINETFSGVRDDDTRGLLERGQVLYPELMKVDEETQKRYFDIVRVNVGFRPARKDGLNLSVERKADFQNRDNDVLNNYGAGGMGYELAYGSGVEVYNNLLEFLVPEPSL